MGYPLMFEVLDFAPSTLTHREKLLLVVLADDAKNETRITYSSVQDPKILHRAKLTRSQLYEVLKGLVAKGVLKKITHGQQNATAKYMILPLGPDQSPQNRDADESQSPGMVTSESRNDGLRVQETGTPTVSTVSTASTTSSKSESAASGQQRKNGTAPTGPIPGDEPHLADVEAICNHLADAIQKLTNERPKITKRDWRDPARLLLDKDGRTPEQILTAIDWAHGDAFWRGVITSPKALRSNYAKLQQKAAAEQRKTNDQQPSGVRKPLHSHDDWNTGKVKGSI
jgi:hypothetical protein